MTSLIDIAVKQFRRPDGLLGRLAGEVMARRPSNQKRNLWTLSLLNLRSNDRIFELGCGPGFALARAAQQIDHGFVTGVDHSAVMINMARARLSPMIKKGRANILIGDENQLKAFEQNLDVIYSANVIQFLTDPSLYFALSSDALGPDGRIATTYQPRGRNPSREKAQLMASRCEKGLRDAGFKQIRTEWLELHTIPAICVLGEK